MQLSLLLEPERAKVVVFGSVSTPLESTGFWKLIRRSDE